MPVRHTVRQRALSNGQAEERLSRKDLLNHSPPLPLSFRAGLSRAKWGGSTQVNSNYNVLNCDNHTPRLPLAQGQDCTDDEVFASIWRPSLCNHENLSPPTSPGRFLFAQSSTSSTRPGVARLRQGSLKKRFHSLSFPSNVVNSLLKWPGKREKKASTTLGSTSFLDFSASDNEMPLLATNQLRHTASEWPLSTPPRAKGGSSTTTVSPSVCKSPPSSASSSLLYTPDSVKTPSFASETTFIQNLASDSSSISIPSLYCSSPLIDSYSHSPLEVTRSFERLRGSLAWREGSPMVKKPLHINRQRNRAGLPPLSPPPTNQLPAPPSPLYNDSLQPTFLQWERELKDLSTSLHEEIYWDRPAQLRVNQSIKRSLEMDYSTPSTVTPSILTPQVEAFEFDLDDHTLPSSPIPRLSPVPLLIGTTSTSTPPTIDSSFTQAVHSFPSPPLRCRSSSVGVSSLCYYSAESETDPISNFSISSSSSSVLTSSSHQFHQLDNLTTSSQCTASLYNSACDRYDP